MRGPVSVPTRATGGLAVNAAIVGERPTGLGIYGLQLVRALDDLGERMTVFTSCPEAVDAPHARVVRVTSRVRPERGAAGHLARLAWTQTALRAHLRRAGADALLNLMVEGVLASAVPQVTVIHDVLPLHYPAEYPRQQYYFRHYVPRVLAASRRVIVSSASTRRDLERFYPRVSIECLRVVAPGYDARRFAPAPSVPDGATPYALYVGNVMPHKNLVRVVEAFATARVQVPARLVIRGWGRPHNVARLRETIARLGLEPHVDWAPYAADAELPALYRGARMLLLPSLHEGFGMTLLEAMACGTPVLTSCTSSMPEVVGEAALLVDPLDTRAIADGMTRLFTDDTLADDLRARGLGRAKLFSWETTGRAVQQAVHEVQW
jgi:glycosyltransferase involved in cell wall biosynthesis